MNVKRTINRMVFNFRLGRLRRSIIKSNPCPTCGGSPEIVTEYRTPEYPRILVVGLRHQECIYAYPKQWSITMDMPGWLGDRFDKIRT